MYIPPQTNQHMKYQIYSQKPKGAEQSPVTMMGKFRNRTFSKIENLRFLQNYDDYNCIFGIKLKGLIIIFYLKGHAVKLKCVDYKIF